MSQAWSTSKTLENGDKLECIAACCPDTCARPKITGIACSMLCDFAKIEKVTTDELS